MHETIFVRYDEPILWTTTPPTEPGWYWARYGPDSAPEVVVVCGTVRNLVAWRSRLMSSYNLSAFCDWAGPLTPPEA